ncbi:MAG: TonB-dependent receptor [Chitinophagaceae bacterium]|nr:TonB-dependent receptor [Chitinophagaceae bacterium]
MKRYILLLFILTFQTNLKAQSQPRIYDSLRNIELPAALIKANRDNLLSDQYKNKVDKALMQRINQAQDLPYLLNGMSSVVVSSDGGTGTGYTGIRIRGADITRINVTLNGVPVNDPESQATFFVNTPDLLSSAKEVQVTKGVGNSKNGVGNFGASIAINTLDVQDKDAHISYVSDYGTFNTFKNTFRATTGLINEKFIATVRASAIQSDGYVDRSSANLKSLQITGRYLINEATQLTVNCMTGKEKTGMAWNGVLKETMDTNRTFNELGMKSDGSFYRNQSDNYRQDYYQLFFDHKLNKHFASGATLFYTRGAGYYEEYRSGQSFVDYGLQDFAISPDSTIAETDLIRQLWLDNHFIGGRLYLNYFSSNTDAGLYVNLSRYIGRHFGEVKWAQYGFADDYRWYDLDAFKTDLNMYAMVDHRFARNWSFFADLQYRQVQYDLYGFRKNPQLQHQLSYQFLNPKLKLTYLKSRTMVSLQLGLSQKEPNRDDIEAGVSQLPKPEKLYNSELSFNQTLAPGLQFYLTHYLMYYRDQLVLTGKINDVGAYTRSNIPESYRSGIEAEITWNPNRKWVEINANIAWSVNKITAYTEYLDDYDQGVQVINQFQNTDISFSPACIAGARFSFFPFRLRPHSLVKEASVDLMNKYVGKQFLDNTSNPNRMLNAYATTDLMFNLPFRFEQEKQLNLRLGVYNVFNALYENNGYTYSYIYGQSLQTFNYLYPQSGRRLMIGAGISL